MRTYLRLWPSVGSTLCRGKYAVAELSVDEESRSVRSSQSSSSESPELSSMFIIHGVFDTKAGDGSHCRLSWMRISCVHHMYIWQCISLYRNKNKDCFTYLHGDFPAFCFFIALHSQVVYMCPCTVNTFADTKMIKHLKYLEWYNWWYIARCCYIHHVKPLLVNWHIRPKQSTKKPTYLCTTASSPQLDAIHHLNTTVFVGVVIEAWHGQHEAKSG